MRVLSESFRPGRQITSALTRSSRSGPSNKTAGSSESDREEATRAFARAKAYLGSHEWTKAEQSFRYAVQLDGSVAEYHAALGSLMMTLKRWDEAEAEFAAALLLDVDNAEYRQLLKSARS